MGADDVLPVAEEASHRSNGARLIDGAYMRERRMGLGLSQASLAAALHVDPQTIRRIEDGHRQNTRTIGFVLALAKTLGVTPDRLLRPAPPATTGDVVHDDDVRAVGALLASAIGWVAIDVAADALGWTLGRMIIALERLHAAAPGVGLAVAWCGGRDVRLVPAATDAVPVRRVTRRDITLYGVNQPECRVLHELTTGPEPVGAIEEIVVSRLRAAALVEIRVSSAKKLSRSTANLTDEARFNLCLDELGVAAGEGPSRTRSSRLPLGQVTAADFAQRPSLSWAVASAPADRLRSRGTDRDLPAVPPRRKPARKYDPLRDHLLHSGPSPLRMTFDEIATVVGGLPNSAWKYRSWWANDAHARTPRYAQVQAWTSAGRHVEQVSLADRWVVFSAVVNSFEDGRTAVAIPAREDQHPPPV